MTLTIRSKLIIGYFFASTALIMVALYGYVSFSRVVSSKEIVLGYMKTLLLSDGAAKTLSKGRNKENNFLLTSDARYARELRQIMKELNETSSALLETVTNAGDTKQIEMTRTLMGNAQNYLENFKRLETLFKARGLEDNKGIKSRLSQLRKNIRPDVSDEFYYHLKSLEMEYRLEFASIDTLSYMLKVENVIRKEMEQIDQPKIKSLLNQYLEEFNNLGFLDLEIKHDINNLNAVSELIEFFIRENTKTAQHHLSKQKQLMEDLSQKQDWTLFFFSIGGVLFGIIGLFSFGMEPLELAKISGEQSAILEAMNDGLIAVNRTGEIRVVNKRARSILNLKQDIRKKHISDVLPQSKLLNVLENEIPEYNQEQRVGEITIITNRLPIRSREKVIGGVACFRNKEEVTRLAEELTQVKLYIDALRSNNHEFQNRLQTIQGMIQLNESDEVIKYIQNLQNTHKQKTSLYVDRIKDIAISSILLGKYARAQELGIFLWLAEESKLDPLPPKIDSHAIVSVLGNLIQNALESVVENPIENRHVWVSVKENNEKIFLSVKDNGPGIAENLMGQIFEKGFSTKHKSTAVIGVEKDKLKDIKGLGLHICKNHIDNMGAEIQYRSKKHTIFEVIIPKSINT